MEPLHEPDHIPEALRLWVPSKSSTLSFVVVTASRLLQVSEGSGVERIGTMQGRLRTKPVLSITAESEIPCRRVPSVHLLRNYLC